jgi:2-methylisocitrate lyase-like PEP mutase family enzyme
MDGGMAFAPFVFDGLQAKLAVAAGFEAVYMTGFGTAASHGLPDMGLLGRAEMSANAARIASAVDVPVIADADTGYGDESSVGHTVRVYERTGVAAMHIEDQQWPKRCGFLDGKSVIPADEMVLKVQAALAARSDPDFVIIARTDAFAPNGWEDAMERARRYYKAGADVVFVDGLKRREDVERAAEDLRGIPQLLNSLYPTPEEARALGFKVYIHIGTMMRHVADFRDSLGELRHEGRIRLAEEDSSVKPVTELLGGI